MTAVAETAYERILAMSYSESLPHQLYIRDMGAEVDVAAQEMGAFSDTRQRRREHPMRTGRQQATRHG
jgi:hypothetical protein